MIPARYVSDLPVVQGESALICMCGPRAFVSDSPGLHDEWTLRTRVRSSLEFKAEVGRRRAGALTLSRKSNDGLVSRRGRSREDICGSQ